MSGRRGCANLMRGCQMSMKQACAETDCHILDTKNRILKEMKTSLLSFHKNSSVEGISDETNIDLLLVYVNIR